MNSWHAGPLIATKATPLPAPEWSYLWAPIGIGGAFVLVLVAYIGWIGIPYRQQGPPQTAKMFTKAFWTTPFHASGVWTFNDSWATNITAVGTLIGTLFATTGALDSVLPGYDQNPFITMNIVCGGITVLAPLLFGVLYVKFSRRYASAPANATYKLAGNSAVSVPAGATISVANGATIKTASGLQKVKAGGTIPSPPSRTITLYPGTRLALPGGTDIAVQASGTLTLDNDTWIADSDLEPAQHQVHRGRRAMLRRAAVSSAFPIRGGDRVTVIGGAKISVTGVANIMLPWGTTVTAPGYLRKILSVETPIVVPPSTDLIAADMRCLIPAASLTIFGIGTEIGMVAILAGHFSRAGSGGHVTAWIISAIAAVGLIVYAVTAMRALADPAPGSSLSGRSGTSFTL
jgi:hypothetical protein